MLLGTKKYLLFFFSFAVAKRFQDYIEPGSEIGDGVMSPLKPTHGSNENLSSSEIQTNLGLDIVVIITKTDYISTLEKQYDYKDEHFDFIQLAVRNFCLCCILLLLLHTIFVIFMFSLRYCVQ